MDDQRKARLVAYLRQKDTGGLPFAKAKEELRQQGYTDAEIIQALYEAPYDGKPNAKPRADLAAGHLASDPESAGKVADALLKDVKKKGRDKVIAEGLAAGFAPGRHAQSYYEFRFLDSLGLPYFKILFVGIALMALVVFFHLPNIVWYVYGAGVAIWILAAFIRRA